MSTDIFETAADGTGTVRAAFDTTAAECRPDIDALTRRALDRGQRVRRHRMVGKAVGSAAAAAAIGLGTAYALNDSGTAARPANIPGSGTYGGNQGPELPDLPGARTPTGLFPTTMSDTLDTSTSTAVPTSTVTVTVTASVASAVATWRTAHRGTLTFLRAAAWM
ncbi:hypothetical protein KGQ20_32410 [Catenulispora sp. NF23]|uniref:Uncharacterized protein n=1 Tax=Catenulispora pinistramenti TaxID=2705254 RepID=A0ABS5L3X8_9ACTN|nr:hypothetical protein [Catenulispora pinistramenti]MBS2537468.1 hypothetical protein [Catenulispora pinistramenti]MBS2553073.1 hypothetical protein [Catenulispora pinistramenti]